MNTSNSKKLYIKAKKILIGGVNSPVRSFRDVGGAPLFIKKANQSLIYDVDGNEYIDYVNSWGALILGHTNKQVTNSLQKYILKGTSFGATNELEINLAELIVNAFPSIEMVRFVNSGTEAITSAINLAKEYTKKEKIIKFHGGYHGSIHQLNKEIILLPYNDFNSVEKTFKKFKNKIACVIIEPIAGNMGVIPTHKDFLIKLREITEKMGVILIFDEIISGFRLTYGGFQSIYNIYPDITCLGKIIGGGLPIGAYCGKEEIMKTVSPLGSLHQAGTFSGNPLSMISGITTLKQLDKNVYENLDHKSKKLQTELEKSAFKNNIKIIINRYGSMLSIFFTNLDKIENYFDVQKCNGELYSKFFWKMLDQGIYFPPNPFQTFFMSTAHTEKDIKNTISASDIILNNF